MKYRYFVLSLIFVLMISACGGNAQDNSGSNMEDGSADQATPTLAVSPTPTEVPLVDPAGNEGLRHFVLLSPDTTVSYSVDETFFEGAADKIHQEAGDNTAVGVSSTVDGEFYVSSDGSQVGSSLIRVDMNTLKSDSSMRDDWLIKQRFRSYNPQFQYAQLVITELIGFPDQVIEGEPFIFELVGDLTVLETTLPVIFDFTAELNGDLLTGQGEAFLFMADFGIDPPDILNILRVVDGVTLTVDFVAEER